MDVLKTAGARSAVEAIEGWTPDSVAIFHHHDPSSRPKKIQNQNILLKVAS